LVASHSHPRIVPGGAEITAYHLFKALQTRFDTTVWFLGCGRDSTYARSGSAISQPFSDQEFLYSSSAFDWFKFANRDQKFPSEMIALLQELQPDVLHFHHFINFGVEVFQLARRTLPHASIILTLHEYLAICHHFGQMVTTGKRSLCYEANNVRCNACFPEVNASDFFLRKLYITQFFAEVDQFIAPSHFLADRFVRWGLPAEKIRVIENIIASATEADHQDLQNIDGSLRIGFFGQISWLKGCDVLLGAAELLHPRRLQQPVTRLSIRVPSASKRRRTKRRLSWALPK
jgi:glycosyltransferase involved in cell wall biosynthesis